MNIRASLRPLLAKNSQFLFESRRKIQSIALNHQIMAVKMQSVGMFAGAYLLLFVFNSDQLKELSQQVIVLALRADGELDHIYQIL
jgi:hypothetical protein